MFNKNQNVKTKKLFNYCRCQLTRHQVYFFINRRRDIYVWFCFDHYVFVRCAFIFVTLSVLPRCILYYSMYFT